MDKTTIIAQIIEEVFAPFDEYLGSPQDKRLWIKRRRAWAPVAASRIIERLDKEVKTSTQEGEDVSGEGKKTGKRTTSKSGGSGKSGSK
jgi:hypothetical protein